MVDAGRGELKDFLGNDIEHHSPEFPEGVPAVAGQMGSRLPMPVETPTGMHLERFNYNDGNKWRFTIVLYDKWGRIVKQFKEDTEPDINEIREALHAR